MRSATIERRTGETDISLTLTIEGTGEYDIATGIPFLDHMLSAVARHGRFDIICKAIGDLPVGAHHTMEDVAIVLGSAFREAVGEGCGLKRYAHVMIPMDESCATVVIDLGGRPYLVFRASFVNPIECILEPSLIEHFFISFCYAAGATMHMHATGRNEHHKCEALFKAFGIALADATSLIPGYDRIPSTKETR
ncbi:MAG: imidazoleglycerol-phosphate dehydratase HisB [Methanospirillaceae archaeon]|nr:imidazoleglycerol-phosphate dehydratase HisB [Methanospirillaceae archaeon]